MRVEEIFGRNEKTCKLRRSDKDGKILLHCALTGDEDGAVQAKPVVVQTKEDSSRLDKQVKQGGIVAVDFSTDTGLSLLLRGHAQQGLFVAIIDDQASSSVFCGVLQPGWAAAYLNKAGATAKFALTTQSAAAAELAKLGMPELTLSKEAKKAKLLRLAALCRVFLVLMLHVFLLLHPCMHMPTAKGALVVNTAGIDSKVNRNLKGSSTAGGQMLQVVGPSNNSDATGTIKSTIEESLVTAVIDSKATATNYTAADTANTTEAAMESVPRLKFALQIDTVAETDTAVTDAATSLRVNKDVSGVKGTEGIVKGVQDLSAISDTGGATNGQGSAKQSSGIVATSAVGAAGSSSGKRKGMTLSLAPLVTPADIYSGAGATGAFVLPQVTKAGGIRKSFNLSLDTTASSTTVNTAGSNISNTENIKDNTTSLSLQGIAGVDMLNVNSTLGSNNSAVAAGITTTGTTVSNAGVNAEYSDVQQFDGVMPTPESFQYVRPSELELDKYVNSTKTTTESTGTYILHLNCVRTVTFQRKSAAKLSAGTCSACWRSQCVFDHSSSITTYRLLTYSLLSTTTYAVVHIYALLYMLQMYLP
eukprot:3667-Heterococcus_DN1.PRE.1